MELGRRKNIDKDINMKELILRDIYLIRKKLLITFGIFAGIFMLGFLAVLSAKYGNIAKYAFDSGVINDVLQTSTAFGIVAGVILGTSVEHIYNLINKDYNCGWHQYLLSSGIKPETIVGVKYLMVVINSRREISDGGYYRYYMLADRYRWMSAPESYIWSR